MKPRHAIAPVLAIGLLTMFGLIVYAGLSKGSMPRYGGATFADGSQIVVEIADTPVKQAAGLSGRPDIEEAYGMLFTFTEYKYHGIWMFRMNFPIDILWLDGGVVVYLVENAPTPIFGQKMPTFYPTQKATQVLELQAGYVAEHRVKIGDYIEFSD